MSTHSLRGDFGEVLIRTSTFAETRRGLAAITALCACIAWVAECVLIVGLGVLFGEWFSDASAWNALLDIAAFVAAFAVCTAFVALVCGLVFGLGGMFFFSFYSRGRL